MRRAVHRGWKSATTSSRVVAISSPRKRSEEPVGESPLQGCYPPMCPPLPSTRSHENSEIFSKKHRLVCCGPTIVAIRRAVSELGSMTMTSAGLAGDPRRVRVRRALSWLWKPTPHDQLSMQVSCRHRVPDKSDPTRSAQKVCTVLPKCRKHWLRKILRIQRRHDKRWILSVFRRYWSSEFSKGVNPRAPFPIEYAVFFFCLQ